VNLFRVFPCLPDAAERELGGPLFSPAGAENRIDNPELYRILYASSHAEAAVAEWLGRLPVWEPHHFNAPRQLSIAVFSLATISARDDAIVDLDDARELLAWDLRPSDVVTRNYSRCRTWAARIFNEAPNLRGVRWWSFYNPDWGMFGRWRTDDLTVNSIEPLSLDHPAVVAAAEIIARKIERPRPSPRR